jgi:soluble lytic murein transglycosylase-like protein
MKINKNIYKFNKKYREKAGGVLLIIIPAIIFLLYAFFTDVYKTSKVSLNISPEKSRTSVWQKLEYIFNGDYSRVEKVIKYSKKNNIPALLTASVIFAESSNYPYAVSRVKARGLMQLMKDTAIILAKAEGKTKLAKIIKTNPAILFDTDVNLELGTRFLKELKAMSGNWGAVLHSYNVGPYAYKMGRRNHPYVNKILGMYKSLKGNNLVKIHKKYGNYLANLYGRKLQAIVMR